jgi:hypothetical protein
MQEKGWLQNNLYYHELDESRLMSIFYFSLIWNLYEKELCAKNGKIGEHPENHSQTFAEKVDQNQLIRIFDYFKQRYVLDGQPTDHFNTFEFKSEPIKNEVFGYYQVLIRQIKTCLTLCCVSLLDSEIICFMVLKMLKSCTSKMKTSGK